MVDKLIGGLKEFEVDLVRQATDCKRMTVLANCAEEAESIAEELADDEGDSHYAERLVAEIELDKDLEGWTVEEVREAEIEVEIKSQRTPRPTGGGVYYILLPQAERCSQP